MKKNIFKAALFSAIALMSIESFAVNSSAEKLVIQSDETKTETFKVYGNCGMCEKKIEGSLKKVKGVKKADWNVKTKMMKVTFMEGTITLDDIKKKIAAVGYDTEKHRASDKVYNNLHGCCQYDRPGKKKEDPHKGHNH